MLFKYQAVDQSGAKQDGSIDAVSRDVAISSLQRRGLVVSSVEEGEGKKDLFSANITLFENVSNRDVVLLSREISTLFEAQVSALRIFRMLATEAEKPLMQRTLTEVGDDIQSGISMSKALAKHPKVFSEFYVSMVRAAEESGRLDETFVYLADYLDRNYEVMNKAKNALIYPAFVVATFAIVMILMMTFVIPRISSILTSAGQDIPIYTKIVIAISFFFVNYGVFLFNYLKTPSGKQIAASFELAIPYVGDLNKKLYLSRIADNLATMLDSGVSVLQALEVTANVVGNAVYADILTDAVTSVKGGGTISGAFEGKKEIPGILVAMLKVGEETGEVGRILKTLAKFYQREVSTAVDTLVGLIEPIMIVVLGLGVGVLLASVLIPIYNMAAAT